MSKYNELRKVTVEQLRMWAKAGETISSILQKYDTKPNCSRSRKYISMMLMQNEIELMSFKRHRGVNAWDQQELTNAIRDSYCWSDVVRKMGKSTHGVHLQSAKKYAAYYLIDTTHFDLRVALKNNSPMVGRTLDQLLVSDSPVSRSVVKARIIKEGLLEYKCVECGLGSGWNGKPITLQLDHINGVSNDHRLCNLRFLCPNCHTQTDTYGAKNK